MKAHTDPCMHTDKIPLNVKELLLTLTTYEPCRLHKGKEQGLAAETCLEARSAATNGGECTKQNKSCEFGNPSCLLEAFVINDHAKSMRALWLSRKMLWACCEVPTLAVVAAA